MHSTQLNSALLLQSEDLNRQFVDAKFMFFAIFVAFLVCDHANNAEKMRNPLNFYAQMIYFLWFTLGCGCYIVSALVFFPSSSYPSRAWAVQTLLSSVFVDFVLSFYVFMLFFCRAFCIMRQFNCAAKQIVDRIKKQHGIELFLSWFTRRIWQNAIWRLREEKRKKNWKIRLKSQ